MKRVILVLFLSINFLFSDINIFEDFTLNFDNENYPLQDYSYDCFKDSVSNMIDAKNKFYNLCYFLQNFDKNNFIVLFKDWVVKCKEYNQICMNYNFQPNDYSVKKISEIVFDGLYNVSFYKNCDIQYLLNCVTGIFYINFSDENDRAIFNGYKKLFLLNYIREMSSLCHSYLLNNFMNDENIYFSIKNSFYIFTCYIKTFLLGINCISEEESKKLVLFFYKKIMQDYVIIPLDLYEYLDRIITENFPKYGIVIKKIIYEIKFSNRYFKKDVISLI